jgi:hypothetical protein
MTNAFYCKIYRYMLESSNIRESILDDMDINKEQLLMDHYFRRLDTAKGIVCKWRYLGLFMIIYIYSMVSSIVGILFDNKKSNILFTGGENILIVLLLLLVSMTCFSSVSSYLHQNTVCPQMVIYNYYIRSFY